MATLKMKKICEKNWTDQFDPAIWCSSVVSIPTNSASNGSLAAPQQRYRHPFSWLSIPIWATMMRVNKRECKWDFEKGHFSLYANIFRTDWWHLGNNAKINQWWEQQLGVCSSVHKYVHSTMQESQGCMGHRFKHAPVFDRTDRMGYGGLVSVSVHAERMLVKAWPGQVATSVTLCFHCPQLLKYAFFFIPQFSLILNRNNVHHECTRPKVSVIADATSRPSWWSTPEIAVQPN